MSALGEAYALERALSRVYRAESWIVEDIGRTFPIRLFRQGQRLGAEPVLEAVYSGMDQVLRTQPKLAGAMLSFDKAFQRAMRPQAKHAVAMKALEKQQKSWRSIKAQLLEKDRAATEDFVAWLDRDVEERMAIARKLGGSKAPAAASRKGAPATPTAVTKKLTRAEKEAVAVAEERAEAAQKIYDAFCDAAARSKPDEFDSFNRLAAYFRKDDPLWERLADKVLSHRAGKDTGDVVHAIQGVIGEALALRNSWVVNSIIKANERAIRIASKLGSEWKVVLTQAPVFATTKSGGLGEIYDASLWIVRNGAGGELEAAPAFILQVKSGGSREAAEQIARDFSRETIGEVRLPVMDAASKLGESATGRYKIKNLHQLLRSKGLKETKGEVGGLTTQRMLVSPRAPSTGTLIKHLPKGTTIEYVGGLLTKREVQGVSEAIRNGLKTK